MCSKISDKEWSGMLFYNIEGTIKDVPNMIITPSEIFLRDIGTKVSTAFEYDEECMGFVEKNDLYTTRHGMVHSHNTMPVFFSVTDIDELQDNVGNHNIYLSLVVNNYMDMTAKVVFIAKPAPIYKCTDEDGNPYDLETDEAEPIVFVYNCKIEIPREEIVVDDQFKKTLSIVRKKVAERNKIAKEQIAQQIGKTQGLLSATGASGHNSWGRSDGYGDRNFIEGSKRDFDFQNRNLGSIEDVEPEDENDDNLEFDDFFSYCFNGGSHTVLDVFHMVEDVTLNKTGDIITDSIVSNYALYYESYFETDKYGADEEEFKNCLDQFIMLCETEGTDGKDYSWLSTLATGLRLIGHKFEELNLNEQNNDTEV